MNILFKHKYSTAYKLLLKMILKYFIYLSRFVKHFYGDCGMDWLFLRDNLFKRQSVN